MKCINGVISWFKLTHENYLFWTRSDDRFRCSRSSWIGGDNRGFDYVSLFIMHVCQSIGSFSCYSVSFMNDDFVLYWATSIKVVFSCVLEIELQSTRIHIYLVGVRLWWTRGSLCWFLDDSPRDHLPFLSWDSGGNTCRGLSSFRSRLE